jgi:hypothetical protein
MQYLSIHFIAIVWQSLSNSFPVVSASHRNRFAIVWQLRCGRFAIDLLFFAIALRSFQNRLAIFLQSLLNRVLIALRSLCNRFAIDAQSFCVANRLAVALERFATALQIFCGRFVTLHNRFANLLAIAL